MAEERDLETLKIKFNNTDRQVLASYHTLVEGVATFLGEACEVSLHSLEDPDQALVKIVNGRHTNRQPGAPLTEHAQEVLLGFQANAEKAFSTCTTSSGSGEPMRSVFVAIRNGNRVIGLLNISFNMAVPLAEFISTFSLYQGAPPEPANGGNTIEEMVETTLAEVVREVGEDSRIANHEKNKFIVRGLEDRGVFDIKGAVRVVADDLKLSKFTVYSYLRDYRAQTR